VPQRTCVGCRTTGSQRDFIRVVKTSDGNVEVDSVGKVNGRGAYVCSRRSCWDEALTKDRLGRALRTSISSDARVELRRFADTLKPVAAPVEN
jgi:predicted RNA-binding protein YlxR (DUF448 family)